MSDDKLYEITVEIRSKDEREVRHLEGPLPHATATDVAVDLVGTLSTRSNGRVKNIPHTDR